MSERVIAELARQALSSKITEVRLEAVRSLAIYRTHRIAVDALIHLSSRSLITEIRLEAIKVLGGQYDEREDD